MKRRYTEESQIIADIDKCHVRSAMFYQMAERWDKEATKLFKNPHRTEEAKQLRMDARNKRTRAYNLVNKKAVELGEKLSQFRTRIMPSVVSDESIPV